MSENGKILLSIVSPYGKVFEAEVDEVSAVGAWGAFGVLPGHTYYLVELDTGELWYRQGKQIYFIAVSGGVAEVGPEKVVVLAEAAECAEQIDVARAKSAQDRAEQALKALTIDEEAFVHAEFALKRALNRLNVASQTP